MRRFLPFVPDVTRDEFFLSLGIMDIDGKAQDELKTGIYEKTPLIYSGKVSE